MARLTAADIPTLIRLLKKLAATQPWPAELYESYAKIGVGIAIEVVCVRRGPAGAEVFLVKRPSRRESPSEAYPSQWHSPGTILRKRDTFQAAFARLEKRECTPARFATRPQFVANILSTDARGRYLDIIHFASLEGTPRRGRFFPPRRLPTRIIPLHRNRIIPIALETLKLRDEAYEE